MRGLTDKQRNILDFIENFSERQGMSPTVYEIADHFKIKTSTVFAHIKALQRKKYLTRSSKARSISLREHKRQPKHMSFVLPIPILGRINAGAPAFGVENQEGEVYCDREFIGKQNPKFLFALKVQGESMRDMGILDGDLVIVKKTSDVKSGDVVAALIDNETTVKCYHALPRQQVELRPANREFKPQIYSSDDVDIQGVVIGLQRKY